MATDYDKSLPGSADVLLWDFYEKYPQLCNDELPEIENADTQHIIHAIMVGADIIRATLIEKANEICQAIRESSGKK